MNKANTYSEMFARIINDFCIEKGWSFSEFARRAGIPKGTLENIMNNTTKSPNIAVLNCIVIPLETTVSALLDELEIDKIPVDMRRAMAKRKPRTKK